MVLITMGTCVKRVWMAQFSSVFTLVNGYFYGVKFYEQFHTMKVDFVVQKQQVYVLVL